MTIDDALLDRYYRIELKENVPFHTLRNFLYSLTATRDKDKIEEKRRELIIFYGLDHSDVEIESYIKTGHWFQ